MAHRIARGLGRLVGNTLLFWTICAAAIALVFFGAFLVRALVWAARTGWGLL